MKACRFLNHAGLSSQSETKKKIQNDIKILVSVTASVFAVSRRVIKGKRFATFVRRWESLRRINTFINPITVPGCFHKGELCSSSCFQCVVFASGLSPPSLSPSLTLPTRQNAVCQKSQAVELAKVIDVIRLLNPAGALAQNYKKNGL